MGGKINVGFFSLIFGAAKLGVKGMMVHLMLSGIYHNAKNMYGDRKLE